MSAAIVMALAIGAAPAAHRSALTFRSVVEIPRARVTLGDVADLSRLPIALRRPAATLEIARFRPGQARLTFPTTALSARIRSLMPALAPWLPAADRDVLSVSFKAASATGPAPPEPTCLRALAPIEVDAAVSTANFAPSPCPAAGAPRALHYDSRTGRARATRSLPAGEIVEALPPGMLPSVSPHQPLFLRARVGPVIVDRQVEALQPARPGQRLFVMDAGGDIFAVQAPEGAP